MLDIELKKIQPNRLNPRLEFSKPTWMNSQIASNKLVFLNLLLCAPTTVNTKSS